MRKQQGSARKLKGTEKNDRVHCALVLVELEHCYSNILCYRYPFFINRPDQNLQELRLLI